MPLRHVIVVGSANIDYTITAPWLPTPGETVLASGVRQLPGGKGMNQAVASARLGAHVTFIGAVGDDEDGTFLLAQMRADGIDVERVQIGSSRRTGLAIVSVLPTGENGILVVPGANEDLLPEPTAAAVRELADPGAVVVVQAEIPQEVIRSVAKAAEAAGARLVVNLAPYYDLPPDVRELADPLVINLVEASALHGSAISNVAEAQAAAEEISSSVRSIVITLGADGACWATGEASGHKKAPRVDNVVDTTGAGDAFVGATAAMLADGWDLATAVDIAGRVGAFAVGSAGAQSSYPTRAEMDELMKDHRGPQTEGWSLDPPPAQAEVQPAS